MFRRYTLRDAFTALLVDLDKAFTCIKKYANTTWLPSEDTLRADFKCIEAGINNFKEFIPQAEEYAGQEYDIEKRVAYAAALKNIRENALLERTNEYTDLLIKYIIARFQKFVAVKEPSVTHAHTVYIMRQIEQQRDCVRVFMEAYDTRTGEGLHSYYAGIPQWDFLDPDWGMAHIWKEEHMFHAPLTVFLGTHPRVGAHSSVLRLSKSVLYERQVWRLVMSYLEIQ
jgi:hypothetical protein